MAVPCPCHLTPASAISSFRLGSVPIMRPCPLKLQAGTARPRHVLRSQKGAADQPCEPNPGDDVLPKSEYARFYRESMEKFEEEYSAALRALHGPNQEEYSAALRALHGPNQNNRLVIAKDRFFREEKERTEEYQWDIINSDKCFLYGEGTQLASIICLKAGQAIDLASKVMAYASLRSHHPSEISLNTVEQTIRTYVSAFLKVAEDTYHRKADQATIVSFVHALGGFGAVSHILSEDALFAANNIEGISSKYSSKRDVAGDNRKFQQMMRDLENNFMKAPPVEVLEFVLPALYDALANAENFIITTTLCREMALAHVLENTRNAAPSDDREPDASAETGPVS